MAWWNTLPIRSGRPSASGTSYWMDRSGDPISATARLTAEELDVALIDAMCASSKGFNKGNVDTWDRLIGGPVGGPLVSVDTQFDWRPSIEFGFGKAIEFLPKGGVWATDGSGWLVWVIQTVPATEATSQASSPIWAAIIAGTHDAKYVKFGERIVTKMAAMGHPLKRLIIDANHEMNQSNHHQIWAANRTEYVNAMTRTITKIREGADNITPGAGAILKFMHRPGYRVDIGDTKVGAYNTFIPAGIDVLSLSLHPDSTCNSDADVTALFNGTLNSQWYGTNELISVATTMGLPIAFPEWAPIFQTLSANGGACPIANVFTQRFFEDVIVPARTSPGVVCDCVYHQNVRDTLGYLENDSTGMAQWAAMVPNRKALWIGTQSDATVPVSDTFSYTVADDWGSRTANVAVTIQGGGVTFVTATDDPATTDPGVPVVIDVLNNDQASSSLMPLAIQPGSVTTPSPSGTAAITTDNQIRYTPASGAQGIQATFNYTAKPSTAATPTSTATVRVQVRSVTQPPPTGEFPPLGGRTPISVGSAGAFSSAYSGASSGDHVVLDPGITLSGLTLNRPGVVVRARVNQTVNVTGTVSVTASNVFAWGFSCRDLSITGGASGFTLRRMRFSGGNLYNPDMQCQDAFFRYCTFSNSTGGLRCGNTCQDLTFDHCHFFDISGSQPSETLIIRLGMQNSLERGGFLVQDTLFENCNNGSDENETISDKCSSNIHRRVQFHNCRNLSKRFGNNCRFEGCVMTGSDFFGIRGRGHVLNNCSGPIDLRDGNLSCLYTSPPATQTGQFPNNADVKIIGGDGQIRINNENRSFKTLRARVEGRSSPNISGSGDITISPNASEPLAVPRANFPLGMQSSNNRVGINGDL